MSNIISVLKSRFDKYKERHEGMKWEDVEKALVNDLKGLKVLNAMEDSGGEPDVVGIQEGTQQFIFMDCSLESPKGRRSLCYDKKSWEDRKEFKPEGNALDMAREIGIEMLDEADYRYLQRLGTFDTKTSSWIMTPERIRKLGGALFGDFRYDTVFIYHNGASSYYAARGFRGKLLVG